MIMQHWPLWDKLDAFDGAEQEYRTGEWRGKRALYLNMDGKPIMHQQELPCDCFRIKAEVAIPEQVGFIGLVFGGMDKDNYELIYLAPEEIQYDPIMNGSMTWQIYNGSAYQHPLSLPSGEWVELAVEVHGRTAAVYLNDESEPRLVIHNLQHGGAGRRVGVWSYLPAYVRNLSVHELPVSSTESDASEASHTASSLTSGTVDANNASFIANWQVSCPFPAGTEPMDTQLEWHSAVIEENGTLNLNRLFRATPGSAIRVAAELVVDSSGEYGASFGYSDHLRLWINGEEVYTGKWLWNPPVSDGRIRPDHAAVVLQLQEGRHEIRAEITNYESFGWGLSMQATRRL